MAGHESEAGAEGVDAPERGLQETVEHSLQADAEQNGAFGSGLHKRLLHKWAAGVHISMVHLLTACNFTRCIVFRLAINSGAKSFGSQLLTLHFVRADASEAAAYLIGSQKL